MAQLEESKSQFKSDGFGFHEKVNFGKYYNKQTKKGLNVYEIANQGDWKYLTWIINHKSKPGEGVAEFKINKNLKIHAQAAMRLKGQDTKWEEVTENCADPTQFIKYWQTQDGKCKGPEIPYTLCAVCGHRKNSEVVSKHKNKNICNKCCLELF